MSFNFRFMPPHINPPLRAYLTALWVESDLDPHRNSQGITIQ